MGTDKYDLHTIDWSVEGWDAILATDMEIVDDNLPTRIIGTLGETVTAYKTLYFKASDSKWYQALADGSKQPCQGLAVESGNLDDDIRIHRMGEIINTAWAWASLGSPVYLSSSVAGELTQTKPSLNAQIIGYALTATKLLVIIDHLKQRTFSQGGVLINPAAAINIIVWTAPFACTVTAVKGYRVGGAGAEINARRNGVDNHLSSALSLTSANIWMDGGAVGNVAYAAGDKLEIMIVSVTGPPTQVAVQVNFTANP